MRYLILIILVGVMIPARPGLAEAQSIRRVTLDAGHGGHDSGAVSPRGLQEKRVALDIAQRVQKILEGRGLEVIMTRNRDSFVPLADRALYANGNGGDFFVSIHANASPSASLNGFEIYYLSEEVDDASMALRRAGTRGTTDAIVWDLRQSENRRESLTLAHGVMDNLSGPLKQAPQRVRPADFYVLKWTECPAILVETGYLTHAGDERLLRSTLYKDKLAEAIAGGIMDFKIKYETTHGFTR